MKQNTAPIQVLVFDLFANQAEGDDSIPAVTDVRVATNEPVMALLPGGWASVTDHPVDQVAVESFASFLSRTWKDRIQGGSAVEGTMVLEIDGCSRTVNLRCSIYRCDSGEKLSIVIRTQDELAPPLDALGFGPSIKRFVEARQGLLVVCGPTSAGKSTTIASLLQSILDSRPNHVITIEEPIEYRLMPGKGLVSQRCVPTDVPTFTQALHEAMRQRPDVLMVGEVRTREEAEIAIRAAEHGRYVMLTTHARNALGGIQKLLGFFPPDEAAAKAQSLGNTLIGVIHQQLVPTKDKKKRLLAYELMYVQEDQQALQNIASQRFQQLQEQLASGKLKYSVPLATVLMNMLRGQEIEDTDAYAVAYDVSAFKATLQTSTGAFRARSPNGDPVGK